MIKVYKITGVEDSGFGTYFANNDEVQQILANGIIANEGGNIHFCYFTASGAGSATGEFSHVVN